MDDIAIASSNGARLTAYLATPTVESAPGVVLIQEIFGVNPVMRKIADTYAAAGYIAIVPDLFWRQEPGVQLNADRPTEFAKGLELYQNFDEDKGTIDLIATLDYLRQMDSCTGKVGTVGFCLGGKLAYLMATRSDADCNVSYYGVGIENNLDESSKIQKPLMLHLAENDEFVPPPAQEKIKEGLKDNPWVTIYSYPGVSHAFSRIESQAYVKNMAEIANRRTMEFLQQHFANS